MPSDTFSSTTSLLTMNYMTTCPNIQEAAIKACDPVGQGSGEVTNSPYV